MLTAILTMLAAAPAAGPTAEPVSATLGVTANVVRPVSITALSIRADGAEVSIGNSSEVEVSAIGAAVRQLDAGTISVTSDRSGPMAITIVY